MKQTLTLLIALVAIIPAIGREVKGRITGEDDVPLDFVNVVLYRDSTYLTGTVTDTDGVFTLQTDIAGTLTAKASFVGYETFTTSVPASGNLGTIKLVPTAMELGEVVVTAARPSTVMKGNALVTNVEGSALALAGTASDVLARVPMVVDNGGSLEVFGKGSPEIYINGRKVNDLQELAQLNSQDIKNVSVITNPGAAYAADVKSVSLSAPDHRRATVSAAPSGLTTVFNTISAPATPSTSSIVPGDSNFSQITAGGTATIAKTAPTT